MIQDGIWGELPSSFSRIQTERGGWLAVRSDKAESIDSSVCRTGGRPEPGRFTGRRELRVFRLGDGDRAVIRTYVHGGLLQRWTGDVFWSWPPRPFRELAITEEIRRRGIPTLETYAAYVEQLWGPFYRGWLVTRELEGAQDLWQAFKDGLSHELGVETILRAVAASLSALHREGVYHADLNLRNILVSHGHSGVQGHIIDFDRAKLLLGRLPPPLIKRNLNRILRSINKLDPERKIFLPTYWDQFVGFYYETERHAG